MVFSRIELLQMSGAGAVLICAIILLRALTANRLPRRTFPILWLVALLRLIVPVSVSAPFSAYSVVQERVPIPATNAAQLLPFQPAETAMISAPPVSSPPPAAMETAFQFPVWTILWAIGALSVLLYFAVQYWNCRREFATALPVESDFLTQWMEQHKIRRPFSLRQTDRIASPLTYGVLRPVILLPRTTDWDDTEALIYVLEHEFTHIRRFDALYKLVLAIAVSVHWFNPAVWLMWLLANRDLELACDEAVVNTFGPDARAGYASALIRMEERKSGLHPLASHFSAQTARVRILAIMKTRKKSVFVMALATILVIVVTLIFGTNGMPGSIDNVQFATRNEVIQAFQQDSIEKLQKKYADHTVIFHDPLTYDDLSAMIERIDVKQTRLVDHDPYTHYGYLDEYPAAYFAYDPDNIELLITYLEDQTTNRSITHRIVAREGQIDECFASSDYDRNLHYLLSVKNENRAFFTEAYWNGYTMEEREMLLALRFAGWENCTVEDYQTWVMDKIDTPEYEALLNKVFSDRTLKREMYRDAMAYYLHDSVFVLSMLEPLANTPDTLRSSSGINSVNDLALNWTCSIDILDRSAVKMGDYVGIETEIHNTIFNFMDTRTVEQQQDIEGTRAAVASFFKSLTNTYAKQGFQITLEFTYGPIEEDPQKEDPSLISYEHNGTEQYEPGLLQQGDGYTILLPLLGTTPIEQDAWVIDEEPSIQIWVQYFGDQSAFAVNRALLEAGYQGGMKQENGTTTTVSLAFTEQEAWAVFTRCPDDLLESWDARLKGIRSSFHPDAQHPASDRNARKTELQIE